MTDVGTRRGAVCPLSRLRRNAPVAVDVDGEPVLVVRTDEGVFAIADTCSHAEVSLSEGEVADGQVECWLHGSRFDLVTGQPSGPPAYEPVATYRTEVATGADGEQIVRIHPH